MNTQSRSDRVVLSVACAAAAITVVAFWLPIFQVGGFVYTMIDSYRGGQEFVAAVALPVVLGVVAVTLGGGWATDARVAALAAAVMATLAPVDHLTEAVWRRDHPERFGSPFEFRSGFYVAVGAVAGGVIVFAALARALLTRRGRNDDGAAVSNLAASVAACGLLLAVAGQVSESSKAHLWALPLWPQVGRWWELIVTTSLCGIALWQRSKPSLAAAVPVALAATAATAQQLIAVEALEDDPAVSTTVTLVGFALVAVALTPAFVRIVRADNVIRRA